MRVVSGIAKRKQLITLDGNKLRPTTDRVKEAMFSIIQFDINSKDVLDLFAGSGQIGIEALSRNAKSCTFVDNNSDAHRIEIINLKNTNLLSKAKVILSDSLKFLKNVKNRYDIIFLDPPYNTDLLIKCLNIIHAKLKPDGVVICEHSKNINILGNFENIALQKQYEYGRIMLTFYKSKQ